MVAIPTVNAGEPLQACLDALNRQTFRDFEVIVIDNGGVVPRDHSENDRPPSFPLRVLRPDRNTGFGAAINLAIHESEAPLMITLNDDAELEPGCLDALTTAARDTSVGMCAPLILMRDTGLIDSAGMVIAIDGSSRQRAHGRPAEHFQTPDEVLLPSGCCALYRRAALDEAGLFDEDFFLYCEDTDLGLRLRRQGWRCQYVPQARVTHRYSASAGAFSALKARYVERNRIRVAVHNFPFLLVAALPFTSLARYFWQAVAVAGGEGAAAAYVKGGNSVLGAALLILRVTLETLRDLPTLLKRRSRIVRRSRIASAAMMDLIRKHRITLKELAHT